MSSEARDSGGQGGGQQPILSIGWQVLAALVLSIVFAIFTKMLTQALAIPNSLNVALAGTLTATIMILPIAPRSAKQLGLIVAVVAAGGTLAMLTALAVKIFAWGPWGEAIGTGLAYGPGVVFIVLCYLYLGVEYRLPRSEDRT